MQPLLIDTHAHVYLPEFEKDRDEVIRLATEAGVRDIYMPAIDSTTHEGMLQMENDFPLCKSMMGLHPCSVKENFEDELLIVKNYLLLRRFAAVGEIGLDFYWDKTYTEQQYTAFHRQIVFAIQYSLPVVIHSRNAVDECIDVVSHYPGLRGVFHCFSGTAAQAKKIIEQHLLLGIGGVSTFKNGGLDKVLPEVGLASLVLETDAPYLAPVPYRGKRNQPAYTAIVAERVATLLQLSIEEVAQQTTANAENLFAFARNH